MPPSQWRFFKDFRFATGIVLSIGSAPTLILIIARSKSSREIFGSASRRLANEIQFELWSRLGFSLSLPSIRLRIVSRIWPPGAAGVAVADAALGPAFGDPPRPPISVVPTCLVIMEVCMEQLIFTEAAAIDHHMQRPGPFQHLLHPVQVAAFSFVASDPHR